MNRLDALADMGCVICGAKPAEIHHLITGRFSTARKGDDETIPLCAYHHRHGPRGEAIHAGSKVWRYDEAALLAAVNRTLKERGDD